MRRSHNFNSLQKNPLFVSACHFDAENYKKPFNRLHKGIFDEPHSRSCMWRRKRCTHLMRAIDYWCARCGIKPFPFLINCFFFCSTIYTIKVNSSAKFCTSAKLMSVITVSGGNFNVRLPNATDSCKDCINFCLWLQGDQKIGLLLKLFWLEWTKFNR